MSETSKFTPPAELTESEKLARVKSVRGRANPEGLKNRLARSAEKKVREAEAAERRREREIKANVVKAERLATALSRAEERAKAAKAAKEPKEDDYESYEVSEEPSKDTTEDLDFIKNMKESGVGELEETPEDEEIELSDEDLIPVEEEVVKAEGINVKKQKGKSITSDDATSVSGEINRKELVKAAKEDAAKKVPFISESNIEESRRLAEEEDAAYKKANAKFAPKKEESGIAKAKSPVLEEARARVAAMPEASRKKAEATPLVKKLSGMSAKEGVEHVSKEVKAGKQKLLDEIAARYLKKFSSKENAHKFLLGPEVKGWFKGGQRKDQENYKKLYNELHG